MGDVKGYEWGAGREWGSESGLAKWVREHPEEVAEAERAGARARAEEERELWEFLRAHPRPWSVQRVEPIEGRCEHREAYDAAEEALPDDSTAEIPLPECSCDAWHTAVVDAEGAEVLWSRGDWDSGLGGDVEGLVRFVNGVTQFMY